MNVNTRMQVPHVGSFGGGAIKCAEWVRRKNKKPHRPCTAARYGERSSQEPYTMHKAGGAFFNVICTVSPANL